MEKTKIENPIDLHSLYIKIGIYITMEDAVKLFNTYVDIGVIKSD